MARIVQINKAEAIFEPFFDYNISDIKELKFFEEGVAGGIIKNDWSSCSISSIAPKFKIVWDGELEIEGYDCMRFFLQYSPNLRLSGKATINGSQMKLFENIEPNNVPSEPTGYIGKSSDKLVLTSYELEFESIGKGNVTGEVTLYWSGLLASEKEYLIEEELPKFSPNWEGLLNSHVQASVDRNIFFTMEELTQVKRTLHLPENKSLLENIVAKAIKIEGYEPEKDIREYLATTEHMYRFVRIRDRNRPILEEIVVDLAVAGWLMDNKEWSLLAARIVLSIVHTPKWFEGPACCLEGSDFHHVCFTEDHYLSAVVVALGFLGDIFTEEALKIIMDKIEEAWKWVDFKCSEHGYRYFMNQGIVGCRGQMIGAYALWFYRGKYENKIEESYRIHSEIIKNYLNEEGHCPEGPHYFDYSFASSIYLWILYSKYKELEVEDILPEYFKRSAEYVKIVLSTLGNRACVKLNCGKGRLSSLLFVFMERYCGIQGPIVNDLRKSIDDEVLILDILFLLLWWVDKDEVKGEEEGVLMQNDSGLAAYTFKKPVAGKFWLTCERNPLTGHFHEDRGSIALEAFGKMILPDLGTTYYSNISSKYMHLKEYHNTVYPEGIKPCIASLIGESEAAKAGHNIDSPLTMEMLDVPEAKIEKFIEIENGVDFSVNLSPIYECAKYAMRIGNLKIDNKEQKIAVNLKDHWCFDTSKSLCASFISYFPWKIGEKKAETFGDGILMQIDFDSEGLLIMEQDDFMNDSDLRKVYVLRVKTERRMEVILNSKIKLSN